MVAKAKDGPYVFCAQRNWHRDQNGPGDVSELTEGALLRKTGTEGSLTFDVPGSALGGAWNMPVWNRNRRAIAAVSTASR